MWNLCAVGTPVEPCNLLICDAMAKIVELYGDKKFGDWDGTSRYIGGIGAVVLEFESIAMRDSFLKAIMPVCRLCGPECWSQLVFAPMDGRARLVLEACMAAGLRVPEEIAVLGVDNDPLLCESTVPTLSSIHTGGFRRGQIAAEMLDALMHGRTPRRRAVALPPISVVSRGSTGYDAMSDSAVARAISYIRANAERGGVGVADIVRAAGCSRRYLELRFRTRLGRSIRDELMRERIENVKNLLATSNLTIGEIVGRTGFSSDSHLSQLFRKATGATMLNWRRENRESSDE